MASPGTYWRPISWAMAPKKNPLVTLCDDVQANDLSNKYGHREKFHLVELNILIQNSSKPAKKLFTF